MHTPEYAAGDGVVLRAGAASGFGLAVYILHDNGDVTVYGHMDKILVEPGQYVEAGETIALLGNRGQSTGPHLHFEVHQGGEDGKRIDPVAVAGRARGRRSRGPDRACWDRGVSRAVEESNRRLLRARDAMDRRYAEPLDVPTLARIAHVSEAHFIRTFRATFGETPNRYLQRRRVERAMFLLRSADRSVTDICMDVGFSSLGTFSRVFRDIVGEPPSRLPAARAAAAGAVVLRDGVAATEQFRRSSRGVSAPSVLAHVERDHHHPDLRARPGPGARLLRRQAGVRGHQRHGLRPHALADRRRCPGSPTGRSCSRSPGRRR